MRIENCGKALSMEYSSQAIEVPVDADSLRSGKCRINLLSVCPFHLEPNESTSGSIVYASLSLMAIWDRESASLLVFEAVNNEHRYLPTMSQWASNGRILYVVLILEDSDTDLEGCRVLCVNLEESTVRWSKRSFTAIINIGDVIESDGCIINTISKSNRVQSIKLMRIEDFE